MLALLMLPGVVLGHTATPNCESITLANSSLNATIYVAGTDTVALGPVAGNHTYPIGPGIYDVRWTDEFEVNGLEVPKCPDTQPTPTPTATATASPTSTPTPTASPTATPVSTPTASPQSTPTPSGTPSSTPRIVVTPPPTSEAGPPAPRTGPGMYWLLAGLLGTNVVFVALLRRRVRRSNVSPDEQTD
jgi:hypothetical protein